MDENKRKSEAKRIKDMLNKIENEQERKASYEEATDLSSLLDADPEPMMIDAQEDTPADEAATPVPEAEDNSSLAPKAEDSATPATEAVEESTPAPEAEDNAAPATEAEVDTTPVQDSLDNSTIAPETETAAADTEVTDQQAATSPETETAAADTEVTDQQAATSPETATAEATEGPVHEDAKALLKAKDKEKKEREPKFQFSKKTMIIAAAVGLAILIVAVGMISHLLSLKGGSDAAPSGSDKSDMITYTEGTLTINNVSVDVPTENATYNIAYDYGQGDEEYPSVPYSANAIYFDKDGKSMYDISLYKDSFTRKADIPEGKDASNWFSDWATDDSEANRRTQKDTGSLHGFLVYNAEDGAEGEAGATYGRVIYYFALQDEDGLCVYALEGILYDKDSLNDFRKVMDDSINSIRTR